MENASGFSLALSINHHSIHNATTSMATQAARVIKRNLFILIFISELLGKGGPLPSSWQPKNKWKVNALLHPKSRANRAQAWLEPPPRVAKLV